LEKIEEIFSKPWLERANVVHYLNCACFLEFLQSKKKSKKYRVLDNELKEANIFSGRLKPLSADELKGTNIGDTEL
jgi:hypothetical protein